MGSDMAMERIHNKTEGVWEQDAFEQQDLVIYRSSSYDNYKTKTVLWKGVPDESSIPLIRILIGTIPEKPPIVRSPYDTITHVLARVTARASAHEGSWSTKDANDIWNAFKDAGYEDKS